LFFHHPLPCSSHFGFSSKWIQLTISDFCAQNLEPSMRTLRSHSDVQKENTDGVGLEDKWKLQVCVALPRNPLRLFCYPKLERFRQLADIFHLFSKAASKPRHSSIRNSLKLLLLAKLLTFFVEDVRRPVQSVPVFFLAQSSSEFNEKPPPQPVRQSSRHRTSALARSPKEIQKKGKRKKFLLQAERLRAIKERKTKSKAPARQTLREVLNTSGRTTMPSVKPEEVVSSNQRSSGEWFCDRGVAKRVPLANDEAESVKIHDSASVQGVLRW